MSQEHIVPIVEGQHITIPRGAIITNYTGEDGKPSQRASRVRVTWVRPGVYTRPSSVYWSDSSKRTVVTPELLAANDLVITAYPEGLNYNDIQWPEEKRS